jgi:hypothetical protein
MEILEETFASCRKDKELYILQIEHYWKLMPHLVMPNFQPTIMAFLTRSTFATKANKARKVGEEMENNSRRTTTEIGKGT